MAVQKESLKYDQFLSTVKPLYTRHPSGPDIMLGLEEIPV